MDKVEYNPIYKIFNLTPEQSQASRARGQDVVVSAGAGSGKTSTLVARYLTLLAEGLSPQRLVAITFTEKAAREMRNRTRQALNQLASQAENEAENQRWANLEARMDSARIGTIHSLCAEILRAHPAEAGVDPLFGVLDEGLVAALQAQVIEQTLDWAVSQENMEPLFDLVTTNALKSLLSFLLERRLDTASLLSSPVNPSQVLSHALSNFLQHSQVQNLISDLKTGDGRQEAGEAMASQIEQLLAMLAEVEDSLDNLEIYGAAHTLFNARRKFMNLSLGKRTSLVKDGLKQLRELYDTWLNPWLGGAKASDAPPDLQTNASFGSVLPLVASLFEQALQTYRQVLRQRRSLDFDDLEQGALDLLRIPRLAAHWQTEIDAILVDEFQDTNQRQRQIVQTLRGEQPGRLFVVGDARQSIYRFRGADVSIFQNLRQEMESQSGLVFDLDLTFRSHPGLLSALGDLLAPIMGILPDPDRPYVVPFSPLRPDRCEPRQGIEPPFIEFVLGVGEDARQGRRVAAQALAQRLLELHAAGQIGAWDEVGLLLRASTGFPVYENALEERGIPYVTVAGRGFYDRPEIRDVLNILHALVDPWDDLAVAGLLHSPAFSLSDSALYRLRRRDQKSQPLYPALMGDISHLDPIDQAQALRARAILQELRPQVDRLPVAELLKLVVDLTDYRAMLATAGSRLWRNLDKLLADAAASQMINVRAFLEYVQTLRDVGARQGEASAEALGAVRLMTIHKAKGLEFDIVVLADAARRPPTTGQAAYLFPETGLTFTLDRLDTTPLIHRLARSLDQEQSESENKRLLYVALTRAREKLLISGHLAKESAEGWLKEFVNTVPLDIATASSLAGQWCSIPLPGGQPVGLRIVVGESGITDYTAEQLQTQPPESDERRNYSSALFRQVFLEPPADLQTEPGLQKNEDIPHTWRVTGGAHYPPPKVIGRLVHKALRRWIFPASPKLFPLLESAAFDEGLVDEIQRTTAIKRTQELLARLRSHPLWTEIDGALERHHEVPYTYQVEGRPERVEAGMIDLIYRLADGWRVVDFKTDELHTAFDLESAVDKYLPQVRRYARAVRELLGKSVALKLCFLDFQGGVRVEEI